MFAVRNQPKAKSCVTHSQRQSEKRRKRSLHVKKPEDEATKCDTLN